MDSIKSLLPQSEGFLPYWLLLAGTTAIGNSLQAYTTTHFTSQVYLYNAKPSTASSGLSTAQVTPLQSRTFGTWTFTSALVRLYAAYNLSNPAFYQLAFLTFVIAWVHFAGEWLVYGTAGWGRGLAGPVIVSTGTIAWMGWAWGSYVGQ